MTTFGWKRKAGESVSKTAASKFQKVTGQQEENSDEESDNLPQSHWMQVAKQRNVILLEDARSKSKRLKEEGSILADSERYWEALKKWDEALQLTPNNETILDMKAQALLILHEVFPAVQAAELAVKSNAKWWPAHQTLGRAQLGLGEIKLAITSFSKAIHLNPTDFELWEEDLKWACFLLKQKHEMNSEKSIGKELVKDSTSEELLERRPCKDDLHVSWSQERTIPLKPRQETPMSAF